MSIMIYADSTTLDDDALQKLAMELADQLPSRYRTSGLVIATDPEIGEVGLPSDSQQAGDNQTITSLEITCQIGLDPGA